MDKTGALRFSRADEGRIEITPKALEQMLSYRQSGRRALEAGGILLGRLIVDCSDVVIDDITVPLRNDIRKLLFFFREKTLHQMIAYKKWLENEQSCHYLGDWHTHPQDIPSPSAQDIRNWGNILRETISDYDSLFFIIIGRVELRIWEGNKKDLSITLLERVKERS